MPLDIDTVLLVPSLPTDYDIMLTIKIQTKQKGEDVEGGSNNLQNVPVPGL